MGALWSFGAPFLSFSYTFWFLSPSNKFPFLFVQQQRWRRRRLWNQIISETHSGNGFLCTAALPKHVYTFLLYSILVLLPCHCFLKSLSSSVKPKKMMIQLNLPSFLAHTHTHTHLYTLLCTHYQFLSRTLYDINGVQVQMQVSAGLSANVNILKAFNLFQFNCI